MSRNALAFLFALVLAACTARTDITSFKDPSYAAKPRFNSVVILAGGMALAEMNSVETAGAQAFSKKGARALRGMDVVPPTRQLSDVEFVNALVSTGAQSVLLISAGEKGTSQTYIPPTYYPGQTYGTVNTYGNTSTFNVYQTPGYTTGGYSISKPQAAYSAVLFDVATGAIVWRADGLSRGNAFADFDDLAQSMAEQAVDRLYKDGVF